MGRLLLLLFIIAAIMLLWKAFGPNSWNKSVTRDEPPVIKGPDDDEEFLWELEKRRFKEMRAREEAERRKQEREQLNAERDKLREEREAQQSEANEDDWGRHA